MIKRRLFTKNNIRDICDKKQANTIINNLKKKVFNTDIMVNYNSKSRYGENICIKSMIAIDYDEALAYCRSKSNNKLSNDARLRFLDILLSLKENDLTNVEC
jgi:hypothetical protein